MKTIVIALMLAASLAAAAYGDNPVNMIFTCTGPATNQPTPGGGSIVTLTDCSAPGIDGQWTCKTVTLASGAQHGLCVLQQS